MGIGMLPWVTAATAVVLCSGVVRLRLAGSDRGGHDRRGDEVRPWGQPLHPSAAPEVLARY